MGTTLLYLKDFTTLTAEANVLTVLEKEGRTAVVLDQTIFYPQGGGQPYDQGTITCPGATFRVAEVRFVDGVVHHIGAFETGAFIGAEAVTCSVNAERRRLHARIHSVGHLVDKAVQELGLPWLPGKGYHFPEGPYDEYDGTLEAVDKEKIKEDLTRLCNSYVTKGGRTELKFMSREQMLVECHYTPDYPMEKGELARVVIHDGYAMPCGGTPVFDLQEIGEITIRKLKRSGEKIRVSYDVAR